MYRPMIPMPIGKNATTMRIAIFQKTMEGPDSQTKWSTGGTFLRARNRSLQAFPGSFGGTEDLARDSPPPCASFMVEDMAPFRASRTAGTRHAGFLNQGACDALIRD